MKQTTKKDSIKTEGFRKQKENSIVGLKTQRVKQTIKINIKQREDEEIREPGQANQHPHEGFPKSDNRENGGYKSSMK